MRGLWELLELAQADSDLPSEDSQGIRRRGALQAALGALVLIPGIAAVLACHLLRESAEGGLSKIAETMEFAVFGKVVVSIGCMLLAKGAFSVLFARESKDVPVVVRVLFLFVFFSLLIAAFILGVKGVAYIGSHTSALATG